MTARLAWQDAVEGRSVAPVVPLPLSNVREVPALQLTPAPVVALTVAAERWEVAQRDLSSGDCGVSCTCPERHDREPDEDGRVHDCSDCDRCQLRLATREGDARYDLILALIVAGLGDDVVAAVAGGAA